MCAPADEVNAVVVDLGTYQVKAGYAGEDTPKYIFPSEIGVGGKPISDAGNGTAMEVDNASARQFRAGTQSLSIPREGMEVISPFDNGIVSDWEATEAIWDHIFNDQMRLNLDDHPIMLAEPSHNTKEAREKTVEIMFEKYKVPGNNKLWIMIM